MGWACENICADGRNWAGSTSGKSFRAGPGSPKDGATDIRAGWAAHFLMGFVYACHLITLANLEISLHEFPELVLTSSDTTKMLNPLYMTKINSKN